MPPAIGFNPAGDEGRCPIRTPSEGRFGAGPPPWTGSEDCPGEVRLSSGRAIRLGCLDPDLSAIEPSFSSAGFPKSLDPAIFSGPRSSVPADLTAVRTLPV